MTIETNFSKLLQLGVPIRNLGSECPVRTSVRAFDHERDGKIKAFSKARQLSMYEGLLEFTSDVSLRPVFCISGPVHDRDVFRVGADLMSHYLDNGLTCKWLTIVSGFQKRTTLKHNADVLFITNAVRSSSQFKLDNLRDLIYSNPNSLRIILTAGWTGMDLMDATNIGLNGVLHLRKPR